MQEEETCRVVSRIMLVIHHRNLPQMTTVMMMRSFLSRLSNPIDWRQMEIRCAFEEMRLLRLPMQLIVSQIAEEGKEAPGAEVQAGLDGCRCTRQLQSLTHTTTSDQCRPAAHLLSLILPGLEGPTGLGRTPATPPACATGMHGRPDRQLVNGPQARVESSPLTQPRGPGRPRKYNTPPSDHAVD